MNAPPAPSGVPAGEPIRPVVLLTDFELADWYVAAMKGEILRLAPGAPLVDLTHSIPPGDVRRAAFVLAQAWPWFPEGAVFLAVVDPGVGGARRPLAVRAARRFFVGPDNGVLSSALGQAEAEARALDPDRVGARSLSATFHGRDLFAPAAALLARGADFATLGAPAPAPLRLTEPRPSFEGERLIGHLIHVDRFGNCLTDVTDEDLRAFLGGRDARGLCLRVGGTAIAGLARTYAAAAAGTAIALVGSGGRLEVAVAGGHAATRLGLASGDSIEIEWRES